MSVGHYENFPVASWLLPRRLRPAVAAIYWFARTADDFADEGDAPAAERLARLDAYRADLARIAAGREPDSPVLARLAPVIAAHALPLQPFHDLLDAFSQDVVKQRYASFDEVLDYCRRSANPVGLPDAPPLRRRRRRQRPPLGRDLHRAAARELLAGRGGRLGEGPRVPAAGRPRAVRRERGADRRRPRRRRLAAH